MNKKPLSIGMLLTLIMLFSVFAVTSGTLTIYAVKCVLENDQSLIFAAIGALITGGIAALLMIILIRDHTRFKDKHDADFRSNKKGTNYIEKHSRIYTKNYTNERIRKQIENNSAFFRTLMFMVLLGIVLIILGVGVSADGLYQRSVPCLVFGIVIIYVNSIGIYTFGSLNMFKHIFPACSSKRYRAKEINDLVNHPDTVWNESLQLFVTPKALIGINRGITVIEYDDIVSIKSKRRHHAEHVGSHPYTVGNIWISLIHALLDKYNEWDTFIIIVKTKNHKRTVLSESRREDCAKVLTELVSERKK